MKLRLLLVTFLFSALSWGQILTFEFSALGGAEATATSNFNDVNLSSSTISRGAGLTAAGNGGRFNATNWALTSIANAVSGNDYMEFTITPNATYSFDVTSIVISLQRSATGPRAIALRSSADSFTSDLDTEYLITDNTSTQTFTFTFSQVGNSSAVTYRVYMYAESTGGSGGIGDFTGDDIVVNGTVYSASTTYSVTYDGNGNDSGSVPVDATVYNSGDPVTVLGNTGSLGLTGFTFNGWNTAADGSGTSYVGGNTFNITANTSLYAQWLNTSPPVITSSLTASANEGAAFTYNIIATNVPTSYNATGLPVGLSINTTTGEITGSVATAGVYNVTISATNAYGTDTETLVITITTGPCIDEGFDSGTTAPVGWTFTSIGGTYTSAGNFGNSSPSLQMNATNDAVTTSTFTNATELSFWIKGQGTDALSSLLVEGFNGSWITIENINNLPTTGTTYTYNSGTSPALISGFTQFRFTYNRSAGNLSFDDVYVICGTPIIPEIDIQGNSISIVDGDTTPSLLDDTDFGSELVGNTIVKTFTIENSGVDPLTLTGVTPYVVISGANAADFSVSVVPSGTIAAAGTTTFEITFQPSALGLRTATLSIDNNDADENPYNFNIQGQGITCTPTLSVSSISPTTGPSNTIVTINGLGFLTASTVSFGALNASFTIVSDTEIRATVPASATSGNIVIQDTLGCDLSYSTFTVITDDKTTCDTAAVGITELFISEVTDASTGSLSYIEIFNGTASVIDMTDYEIYIRNNGSTTGDDIPLTGTLAPGDSFTLATSVGSSCGVVGGDGSLADQVDVSSGVNNNDCIHLAKLGTIIDTWGVCDGTNWINALGLGSAGYDFKRKATATPLPSTTFVSTDWDIIDFNSCSDDYSLVDSYEGIRNPPLTTSPAYAFNCGTNSVTLSVVGTEAVLGGSGLTYQWFVNSPGAAGWTSLTNGGIYSNVTTADMTISDITGLEGYQYYCQVMEDTATCYVASNATIIGVGGSSTTWNGLTWSNGVPTSTSFATINGNYDTTVNGNIECCSLLVNTGFTLDIQDAEYVEIQYNLTVNGTLNVLNNGSLVQVDDSGVNTGNVSYQRSTTGVALDYVYWSSPVNGVNTPTGYIYTWSPTFANPNGGQGYWIGAASTAMQSGIGYIMRDVFSRNFIGVPRNGVYTPAISRGSNLGSGTAGPNGIMRTDTDDNWNLLGNPYPSAISINTFLTTNTNIDGFVRLWTHGTSPSTGISDPFYDNFVSNYTAGDYVAINGAGATSGPGTLSVVGGGQGFFVLMNAGAASSETVTFNNSMRDKGYSNSQFYKPTNDNRVEVEKSRIWLDFTSPTREVTRALVAYITDATNLRDRMYDAIADYKSAQNFYTLIGEDIFTIQGRASFIEEDKVSVGFKTSSTGTHSISIATVDGLFQRGQNIYLEDKELNIIHDLRQSPYSFYAFSGVNNERFVLRYTDGRLNNEDDQFNNNGLFVISDENIQIVSNNLKIKNIEVFDVLGRSLVSKTNLDSNSVFVDEIVKSNNVLIVNIVLENDIKISRKVLF
ncbi:choice-of-anchor D domain-containing protein [Flavobacterium sp.]|uniref:choice-of-anchor D domain-containing protein n=1 Tax=Flavobacterium sp. TaxID=239 RepID=UPI003D26BF5D